MQLNPLLIEGHGDFIGGRGLADLFSC